MPRPPALLLAAVALALFVLAWGGGTGAEAAIRHGGDVHAAMPCHHAAEAARTDGQGCAQPADAGDDDCPDGRCASAGCTYAAAVPPAIEVGAAAYGKAPPRARPAARLAPQAETGPPARPPRA